MTIRRKSDWKSIQVCENCNHIVNSKELLHTNRVCPYCNPSTIIKVKTVTYREVKHYRWYSLFNRKITFEGYNNFSRKWLKNNKLW